VTASPPNTTDLSRIRALVTAAAPGPWVAVQLPARGVGPWRVDAPNSEIVIGDCGEMGTDPRDAANAALIAEAPTLIAELCDLTELRGNEVARLAHECGTAKGQRDNMRCDLAKAHALLDSVRRKLGYLLRDYPGDKETGTLIANINALLKDVT
jgi:hypothetical protein